MHPFKSIWALAKGLDAWCARKYDRSPVGFALVIVYFVSIVMAAMAFFIYPAERPTVIMSSVVLTWLLGRGLLLIELRSTGRGELQPSGSSASCGAAT